MLTRVNGHVGNSQAAEVFPRDAATRFRAARVPDSVTIIGNFIGMPTAAHPYLELVTPFGVESS